MSETHYGIARSARWLLRQVDSAVTVNRTLESDLRSWGILVDIQACYDRSGATFCRPLCLPRLTGLAGAPGAILVGSIGRLEEQKGFHWLIYAAARVIHETPGRPLCNRW